MKVPTCQLQHGFGPDSVDIVPYPKANVELQNDAESYYGRHGVNILATCTPYQVGNLPLRGEHCAWMESSAVIYANSVLGARTNCEGIASTGAASLTGKIPCVGNHLDVNRYGTHLVSVEGTTVTSFQDWGMLGYFAGGVSGEDHPVVIGDLAQPDLTELKHFGAAAATSGGVELYHIPGHHARGADRRGRVRRLAGCRRRCVYGPAERRAIYETLNEIGTSTDVDFILLGCPHASVDQIRLAATLLDGKKLRVRDRAVDHGAAGAQGDGRPLRLHRRSSRRPAAGCSPTPARRCRGPRRPARRCSPPTRPSRPTTCPPSSASRRGSAPPPNA